MQRSAAIAVAAAALAAALAPPLAASPAEDPAADGMVFAGVTGADPANVTANPAALVRMPLGWHLFARTTAAYERVTIDRDVVDATGAVSPGPRVDDATVGAGATAGAAWVAPRSFFALAASVPAPDETIDDPAVGFHTRGSRTRRIDWATVAGGFGFTSRVILGLSVTLTGRRQVLAFTRDTAIAAGRDPTRGITSDCGGAACGLENPAATEVWRIDVAPESFNTDNFVYSVGALVRLPRELWLGVSAQRPWQVGRFAMTGDATIVRAPRDGGAVVRGQAVVNQRLPEVYRLGLRGPFRRALDVVGEVRWRRMGQTQPVDVRVFGAELAAADVPEVILRPTGVDDAFTLEVGAEQTGRRQGWRFGGRLGYDTGAVGAERLSARAPWNAHATAAVAAQLRLAQWTLVVGYRFDLQLPTAGGTAFDPVAAIACADSGSDYDLRACAQTRQGFGTSSAAGDYGRQTHTVRVGVDFVLP